MPRTRSADAPPKKNGKPKNGESGDASKSLETWLWDAACKIRGAKDAAKYKDFILPLVFTKRLPNWQGSENELRGLRNKVTFAIYAAEDDLNKVTSTVDALFVLLQKAFKK